MMGCFIQSNNNSEIKIKCIFNKLRENLMNCRSFNNPKPKTFNITENEEVWQLLILLFRADKPKLNMVLEEDEGVF